MTKNVYKMSKFMTKNVDRIVMPFTGGKHKTAPKKTYSQNKTKSW